MSDATRPTPSITLWSIAVPVFIDMVLSFSMFFVDSLFLSRISDLAAASVGTIIPLFVICVILFLMVAQGGANVAGQFLGAQRPSGAARTFAGTLLINIVLGAAVFVTLWFGSRPLVATFGMSVDAAHYASEYLRYISVALFLMAIKHALAAMCMAQGMAKFNMVGGILANALNVLLNAVFMFGFDMGLYGVILATTVAQAVVVLYYVAVVRTVLPVRLNLITCCARLGETLRPILAIGIPAAAQPISAEGAMFVLSLFAVSMGEDAMAARTYVMNLLTLSICWATAVSIANQVIVAHLVGARQYDTIKQLLRRHLLVAMSVSFGLAFTLLVFAEPLLGVFTHRDAVIAAGTALLMLGLVIEPARSFTLCVSYSLKAAGDARFPAAAGLLVTWFVAVPVGYFAGITLGIGIVGLWLSILADEALRGIVSYARWRTDRWTRSGVLSGQFAEGAA